MKKLIPSILLAVFLILSVSCNRSDINVVSTAVSPYVIKKDGRMGVAVYFNLEGYENASTLELHSPDGFVWSLPVSESELSGLKYTGSADAVMPLGLDLPQGKWSYVLIFKDGRTDEGTFEISYTDKEGALERAGSEAGFDAISNLNVLMK